MKLSIKNIFNRVLPLHAGEERPFILLFIHAFFNGLAIALAYAAINIIVIKKQGIEILPWLYIASAILIVLGSLLYNKLEHMYPPKRVFIFSLIFCVIWAFAMRFLLGPDKSLTFIGLAYGTYYLILVLTNLDLWGAAALVFNVRQSKRLFGPLSFAESVGGIIGYSLSSVLVLIIAVQDMMIVSGICFLVSVVILYNMRHRYLLEGHDDHTPKHILHEPIQLGHHGIWHKLFHGNNYIKQLSLLVLLSTLVFYTLTYGFLSRVEVEFTNLVDIAWFVGLFLSLAKVLNLIIKFFFSGHIFNRYGVRVGLYILPVALILFTLIGLAGIIVGVEHVHYYIFLFSALYFLDRLLRSSLAKPSFLVLFQPMTPSSRLSGHTITKGFFEPFAMGLAGGIILLSKFFGIYSLNNLTIYILFLTLCWVVASHASIKKYLVELHVSIRDRLFGSSMLTISPDEVALIKSTKLTSQNEVDRLYALTLLRDKLSKEDLEQHFSQLLRSSDDRILIQSLMQIENQKIKIGSEQLSELMYHDSQAVSTQAAYAFASTHGAASISNIVNIIEEAPHERNAFIGALIKYTGIQGTLAVGHKLLDLVNSPHVKDRIMAARIIDKTDNAEYNPVLMTLIQDANEAVRAYAIRACGGTADKELMAYVLEHIADRRLASEIKTCVEQNSEFAHQLMVDKFHHAPRPIQLKYIDLYGYIPPSQSSGFLLSLFLSEDYGKVSKTIRALFMQRYTVATTAHRTIVTEMIERELKELVVLDSHAQQLNQSNFIFKGIKNEIKFVKITSILRLLSFIYPRPTIDKIIRSTVTYEVSSDLANATELLENLLPNKWSISLIPILEHEQNFSASYPSDVKTVFKDMLDKIEQRDLHCSDVLYAYLLRIVQQHNIPISFTLLDRWKKLDAVILNDEITQFSK